MISWIRTQRSSLSHDLSKERTSDRKDEHLRLFSVDVEPPWDT